MLGVWEDEGKSAQYGRLSDCRSKLPVPARYTMKLTPARNSEEMMWLVMEMWMDEASERGDWERRLP